MIRNRKKKREISLAIICCFSFINLFAPMRKAESIKTHADKGKVIEIAGETQFEEAVLKNDGKTIVKFYAVWCNACKKAKKPFEKLATEHKDVKFVAANIDKNKELADKYNVNGVPYFVVFEDGKKGDSRIGFSKEAIKKML